MQVEKYIFLFLITLANASSEVLIIANGSGGDKNAAVLIQGYLNKKKVKTKLFDTEAFKNDVDEVKNVLIIGQDATLLILSDDILKRKIKDKKVIFYSHIINDKTLSIIKNNQNIRLITTKSELNLLKHRSKNITALPLALPTYTKVDARKNYEKDKKNTDTVLKNPTLHLGGAYKNSQNEVVEISNDRYSKVIKEIIKQNNVKKLSILTHPRTFFGLKENCDIIKRLKAIFINKNIYVYVPLSLFDKLKNEPEIKNLNLGCYENYNAILYKINEAREIEKQFVTIDQYNAFADINKKVTPIFLNENDKNQKEYAKIYVKTPLGQDLLKQILININ